MYQVRVREIHELIYTVMATDEADAKDHWHEDKSPQSVDAHMDEILEAKEFTP